MDNKKIYIIKASIVAILYLLVVAVWWPIRHKLFIVRGDKLFAASFIIVHALMAGTIIGAVELIPDRPMYWMHDVCFAFVETGQKLLIVAICLTYDIWTFVSLGMLVLMFLIGLYGFYIKYYKTHIAHVITTMISVGLIFIVWPIKWMGPLMIAHMGILMIGYLAIHFSAFRTCS